MTRRAWVLVLSAALAAACEPSSEPDAPMSDAGVVNEEVLAALVSVEDALCTRALRCLPERDGRRLLPDLCRTPAEAREEALTTAMTEGASVDRDALEQCLADAGGGCGGWGWLRHWSPPRCDDVVTLPPDRECGGCPDGLFCAAPTERCGSWTCVPPGGLREPCWYSGLCAAPYECHLGRCVECHFDDDDCGDGRYCDTYRGECLAYGGHGAACDDGQRCATGLICAGSVCRAPGTRGEPCGEHACAEGLACLGGVCSDPLSEGAACPDDFCGGDLLCRMGICVRWGRVGDPCERGFRSGTCASPLRCDDGFCREAVEGDSCRWLEPCWSTVPYCDIETHTCTADPFGQPCYPSCPTGSVCSSTGLIACVPTARPGEACGPRRDCQNGICRDGVCVPMVHPTEPCGPDRLCPPGWSCEAGTCTRLPDLGEPCVGGCLRGECAAGTCAWVPPGAPCGDAFRACEHGCREGGCLHLQDEVGGACWEGAYGRCAPGLECVQAAADGPTRYHCVAACPE